MSSPLVWIGLGVLFCLSTVCLIVRINEVKELKQYVKWLEKELRVKS